MIRFIRKLFAFCRLCSECENHPKHQNPDGGSGGLCDECYAKSVSRRLAWKGERDE